MARTPKDIAQARTNYEAVIPLVPERYRMGVQRGKWMDAAASDAAERNFAARMQAAITSKSRQAGVRRAGDAAWQQGALNKGVARIGQGMQEGAGKWATNFGRVYTAVLTTVAGLPPRGIDPMANVDARLKPVVKAFVDNKIRGKG